LVLRRRPITFSLREKVVDEVGRMREPRQGTLTPNPSPVGEGRRASTGEACCSARACRRLAAAALLPFSLREKVADEVGRMRALRQGTLAPNSSPVGEGRRADE
jgi:hypothetical protein